MEDRYVDVTGATLRIRIDGPPGAPWLLMLNSLSTTLEMWDGQIPTLSGHFQVLRYDQRGHGGSSAPKGPYSIGDLGKDALELLDALGIEKVSLCGLSLGGIISFWLAGNAPERIDKVVVACTSANFSPPELWAERARVVRAHGVADLYEGLLARWFTSNIDVVNPQAKAQIYKMLTSCNPEGYASCCEALGGADVRPLLGQIQSQTLVIAGARDPATPPNIAVSLFESLPNSSLTIIPDASHLANFEQPDLFIDAVMGHLVGSAKSRGMAVRTEVLGTDHVERASLNQTEFTAPFQDFISRYAWGEIWTRPGLDRRTRSIVTLSTLVALGHLAEFSFHIPAALRNGLTREEIMEVLLQCGIYAGVPASNSAFAKANEILSALQSNIDSEC